VRAAIYLPDMVFQVPLPFRPVELISDAPARERITIEYTSRSGPRSIEADLYTPAGEGPHNGVVFSMGAPPLELDNDRLVRIAEDSARSGVVMLVPFSDRLDDELILPEEVDALVAEFEYVQALPDVDPSRVGFFGASVGGSLALVAAADPRIADEVDHVVSFGGYYDALDTFGAIATHHIQYGEVDEEWTPRRHAEQVMAQQLIAAVDGSRDRDLLYRWFVEYEEEEPEQLASLSPVARRSYDFLANRDPLAVQDLIERLPDDAVEKLDYLSPKTSIDRVEAELFIIHDVADPFIPYTESRKLKDDIGDRGNAHFDELRLFEHVEPKLQQRPDVIALDSTRLLFRLYQLLLRWD
jgi:dipeptidyl aminopeptidase/acylaminoacyl peptidase